ncbi:metallophosphoesterase [Thermomonas flagellata]|uniref:metallophosphoesterase n=1 Tax=Thermomonas flagellata TaxID=2888524 RepID=UPI001F04098B|nr:metallophosphoesterase [Thermomonas flagellata]
MHAPLIPQALRLAGWLLWPLLALALWHLWRRRGRSGLGWLLLGALLVLAWAWFVEPQRIVLRQTTLHGTGLRADVALVSDLHLGAYKDTAFLRRLVARLDALPVDAVLVAGDLTYAPSDRDQAGLQALLAPLGGIRHPVYAVLGNHDQQHPGPDIDRPLRAALAALGVQVIEGRRVPMRGGWMLAGLGDRWAGKDDPRFLPVPAPLPTLVLAHNPDSASRLSPAQARLLLAGHTHGGQLRIPWLYRRVLPSAYGFDRGEQWLTTPRGRVRVFTTTGTGETGLPLRLFDPPAIDLLHLRP